jgi:hypothetical protein
MTITAETIKATVPSIDLLMKIGCVPYLRPINAADISEIINIVNDTTVISLGNMRTHKLADINTQEAPFNINLSCVS